MLQLYHITAVSCYNCIILQLYHVTTVSYYSCIMLQLYLLNSLRDFPLTSVYWRDAIELRYHAASIIAKIRPCQLYRGADKSLARPTFRCSLYDGENNSFVASLVIYTNTINIPPILIILVNRIHEFLVSNFRHVLNAVCFLVGNSPASEFYMPTFRKHRQSVPKRRHKKFRRRRITHKKAYKDI